MDWSLFSPIVEVYFTFEVSAHFVYAQVEKVW